MAYVTTVNVSSVAGSSYVWSNAVFAWQDPDGSKTWATAYPYTYTLSVGEGWTTGEAWNQLYTLQPQEAWHTAELWSQAFFHVMSESWRTNECWTDIWQLMLRIFEGWITAEVLAKSTLIPKAESWTTTESSSRAHQLVKTESWHTGEAWLRQYLLNPQEGWHTAELAARLVSKLAQESWQTADDQPVWNAIKVVYEAWNNGETITHSWQDFLTFVEGWATSETPQRAVTKPVSEAWHTADGSTASTVKRVLEAWHTAEAPMTQSRFQRVFTEAWHVVDSLTKKQVKTILEVLNLDEAYLRNANAVISDLAFASGDMTLAQFTGAVSSPVGYGPFTTFMPGELEYQKALIALILSGPLTTGRPQVTEWQLTVDVPDRTDSGTLSVPAANIFIPFKARFLNPPEVMVQLRGGSTGTPDITSITDTGFYVQINSANGQPIAGDIVWSAVGY